MLKYSKVINQSNKTVKYTYITIKTWWTGVLNTELQASCRTAEGGAAPAPSLPPTVPTSGSDTLCALRNSLLKQECPQPSSPSLGHPLPRHKQLYLDYLSVWDRGTRREACTGAGSRGSRVQVLRGWPGGGGAPGGHTPWSSLAVSTWGGCNHRMIEQGL